MKRHLRALLTAIAISTIVAACTAPPPTGPADLIKPEITSVEVTPTEVTPGQQMTISATVTDNVGVTGVAFVVRRNGLPAGFCSGSAFRTSGTAQVGVWTLTCTTPQVLNAGTYQVNTAAVDAKLNSAVIGDGPPSATSGHFTVLGDTSDEEGPTPVSVTAEPESVEVGQTLTISAHVTDETGVSAAVLAVRRNGATLGWCVGGASLVAGTSQDGTWQLSCVIPIDAPEGIYTVSSVYTDLLGNITTVADGAAGPSAPSFTVTVPPDQG